MKKIVFILMAGAISVNACTPSVETCPEIDPVPSLGPNMCNLRAERLKVSDTVDTCNLLVQADAYIKGDLRVDGNICNGGSEPAGGTGAEQGILIITSQQFANVFDSVDLVPIIPCGTEVLVGTEVSPVVVAFPIPADFDSAASQPIVIDLHVVGPFSMGTEIPVSFTLVPFISFTGNGDILEPLSQRASSVVMLNQNQYRVEPFFVVEPSASGHSPGDLVRFALCPVEGLDPNTVPRLAAITVRYPKIPTS